jgi:glycosyltransferase involved in cell wall biosynthesis
LVAYAFLLLCFGGTAFYKGVDVAISALAYLPENVYLLVAGKEEHFTVKMMGELAKQNGVCERLKIHANFIPDEQIVNYFYASDITLIPYRNPFSGQSGPLTIAAFLGIPIVASDSPVLEEYVGKYSLGTIFLAGDARLLAAAVSKVLGSVSCPNTEEFIKDHCASKFCQSVVDYYDHLNNETNQILRVV